LCKEETFQSTTYVDPVQQPPFQHHIWLDPTFPKRLESNSCSNSIDLNLLLLYNNCVCLWNMEFLTDRHNFSAVANTIECNIHQYWNFEFEQDLDLSRFVKAKPESIGNESETNISLSDAGLEMTQLIWVCTVYNLTNPFLHMVEHTTKPVLTGYQLKGHRDFLWQVVASCRMKVLQKAHFRALCMKQPPVLKTTNDSFLSGHLRQALQYIYMFMFYILIYYSYLPSTLCIIDTR